MLPTPEQLAHPIPLTTRGDAESIKDSIETEHEFGGLVIVEHETLFYVCYGPDYYKGYNDPSL